MEIEITLNEEDWRKCSEYLTKQILGRKTSPKTSKFILVGNLLVIAYILFFLHEHKVLHFGTFIFTSLLFGAYIFYCWYVTRKYRNLSVPKEEGNFIGTHKLIISDYGIDVKSKHTQDIIAWRGIKEIFQTDEYIFMGVDTNKAHVIPKRDIDGPDIFYNSLCELFNKNKVS